MAKLETYFKQSRPIGQYIDDMTVNKENVLSIYESFKLPNDDQRLKQLQQSAYSKVLVISEDWCGDAMMNLPILKRISEELNWEVRVFHRDEDMDLIDQYLTNGTSRSIPIFIFLNDNYEQETVWGPRAQIVQKFVDDVRSTHLPNKEDANYEDKLNETHVIISNRYKTDSTLWQAVYDSIITKLS